MSGQFPKNPGIGRRSPYPLHQIQVAAGETVYAKGDSNGNLYRVVSGTIILSSSGRGDGSESRQFGTGDVFGQAGLFSGAVRRETAAAVTDVVLDVMERADALKLLERPDEPIQHLLAALFVHAEPPMSQATDIGAPDPASGDAEEGAASLEGGTVDQSTPVRLLLKPSSRPLAAWIGRDPIEITALPFVVGRKSDGEDGRANERVDLVLSDEKPYQLSRLHFAIDTYQGELVVRDSGSYHGTTVNNQRIGNHRQTTIVPLRFGENTIVAGSADSPYCFTLLIEAV
jgi:hypothetical protein